MWTGNAMGTYAAVQYYHGSCPSALKAQADYLSYLAGVERKRPEWDSWSIPWMTDQLLHYERTITYARIAILQTREGKIADAEASWKAAETSAVACGWKDPSREHIREVVNAADSHLRAIEGKAEPRGAADKPQTP